jgi:hypothetical protein
MLGITKLDVSQHFVNFVSEIACLEFRVYVDAVHLILVSKSFDWEDTDCRPTAKHFNELIIK